MDPRDLITKDVTVGSLRKAEDNSNVRLSIKKLPETGEYKVCWYDGNKLNEDKSYYTDDKADAEGTMAHMKRQYNIK